MIHSRSPAIERLSPGDADAIFHPISYGRPPHGRRLAAAGWDTRTKRAIDIAIALLALTVLGIPMLAFALVIRLDSPGKALFRQRRVGLHGRAFELLKFRTMYDRGPEGPTWRQASRGDPRITRVGHVLRCTSVDELPQMLNVLRGDMSLVGPRPHAPGTRAGGRLFEEVDRRYSDRHRVRPGMTGLAQVRGWRGETDTEAKLHRRLECDLEYIAGWSLRLDLQILWRTIFTVLRMRNAY